MNPSSKMKIKNLWLIVLLVKIIVFTSTEVEGHFNNTSSLHSSLRFSQTMAKKTLSENITNKTSSETLVINPDVSENMVSTTFSENMANAFFSKSLASTSFSEIIESTILSKTFETNSDVSENMTDVSLSFESIGCLEMTNVTVLVFDSYIYEMTDIDELVNLITDFDKDPCITVFVYIHNLQMIIQWNHKIIEQYEDNNQNRHKDNFFDSDMMHEVIQSLHQQQQQKKNYDSTANKKTRQTVIVFYHYEYQFSLPDQVTIDALEKLEQETSWNVIIVCRDEKCPTQLKKIPLHRVVSTGRLGTWSKWRTSKDILIALVRDPDFNRSEYLKSFKKMDINSGSISNLDCLRWKVINIVVEQLSFELIDNIALLLSITKRPSPEILLYEFTPDRASHFWSQFIQRNKVDIWRYFKGFQFSSIFYYTNPTDPRNVYIFSRDQALSYKDWFKDQFCEGLEEREIYKKYGIKKVDWVKECRDRFNVPLGKGFIDGVIKASCMVKT